MRPDEIDRSMANYSEGLAFWLVWCPTGPTPPRVAHSSCAAATKAAELLALQCRGHKFFVMKALSLSEVDGVKTTVLK
jgi:hypothetical protein